MPGDELMLISNMGTLVRTGADEVSEQGRNTQGVRLIALRGDEQLVGVGRIAEEEVAASNQALANAEGDNEDSNTDDTPEGS